MNTSPPDTENKVAIHELLARYAWSLDTGDIEGFVACFTEDATLCEDAFDEPDLWVGKNAIREMASFFSTRPSFPGRQHHVTNVLIEGNAQQCSVRAFCFVTDCKNEPPYLIRFCGYYEDIVVKRNGEWLFKQRLIRDWSGSILRNFPGQSGEKKPRQRPAELHRER
jgi:hypothetical protein